MSMYLPRIVVIGAGSVGSTSAAVMAQRNLGSIFLYDIVEDLAIGRAMDINQASPYLQTDWRVIGSNSLTTLNGADIVVIAAGIARQAGMSRLDLLNKNREVVHCLGIKIMESCPRAKIFLVTNPVDILTWYMKIPGLP
jgi:malate dehydrogenase